jgi:hypothetical protein
MPHDIEDVFGFFCKLTCSCARARAYATLAEKAERRALE